MIARRMGMVAVALVVTAGSALAQNDEPRGERPGRGGPGGFGGRGGFGRMGGDRNSYLGLLRMDEVQADLKLTDDQKTTVREIGEEMRNAARPEGLDRESLRDASPEEQQAAFAKMREFAETQEKEVRTKLAAVLDEAQMQRLRGLWVQRSGALAALSNAEIVEQLQLTDEQKNLLSTQREEQRESMRGFGRRGEGGPPAAEGQAGGNFFERMQELRKAADDAALGVLTEDQKTAYAALEGEKFTFPPPQFGGFGGGRGRDRGEGGDRPNRPARDAE